jgi:catechol 2,3-dioxygenase-like lactoylglutathione lyase family enzyme
MIGRLSNVVLDCPDPQALARFYSQLLGMPLTRDDGDWVDLGDPRGLRLSFQRAADHRPPRWPDPAYPQQFHLDVDVDDVDEAERRVLALGASRLSWGSAQEEAEGLREPDGSGFRVYVDPAGHPFCLCWG